MPVNPSKVKLPATAAQQATDLGFKPVVYLTRRRRGVYDAVLMKAGSNALVLVCEERPRA
mgnify:FL=1